ncbi:MAG: 2-oxoacid:acceptor oxidoreductase family protein [Heliobacteriaceae bacterium]|jgi:2-oxoglutarate ferredoxin oxidoreductase subunit gamma|nr:2-oxoacid:acceptor oxidoreductase family protein [Heliobacteriaceae bacterium]
MEYDIVIAGFGGQGVLLAGEVLANAFMDDGKYVTWYPSYGAEMRGGTVNCEIVAGNAEVSAVNKKEVDFLIAMNQLSFNRFMQKVKRGGLIIANSSLVKEIRTRTDITYLFAPITKLAAEKLGNIKMANMLALGILAKAGRLVSVESLMKALDKVIPPHRRNLLPLNIDALKIGYAYDLVAVKC